MKNSISSSYGEKHAAATIRAASKALGEPTGTARARVKPGFGFDWKGIPVRTDNPPRIRTPVRTGGNPHPARDCNGTGRGDAAIKVHQFVGIFNFNARSISSSGVRVLTFASMAYFAFHPLATCVYLSYQSLMTTYMK